MAAAGADLTQQVRVKCSTAEEGRVEQGVREVGVLPET